MRNSHLPFTVSARRLAGLKAVLEEWMLALAPYGTEYGAISQLYEELDETTGTILAVILEQQPKNSSRRKAAIHITYNGEVTIADVAKVAKCPHRTAQTYLASFVAEGWVRRVKPGVYALKIP